MKLPAIIHFLKSKLLLANTLVKKKESTMSTNSNAN